MIGLLFFISCMLIAINNKLHRLYKLYEADLEWRKVNVKV